MIKAKAWSDDRNVEVEFDATPYFQQASALEILQLACCGWAGDYPADDVATYVAGGEPSTGRGGRPGLRRLFQYLEIIADDPAKADCRGLRVPGRSPGRP